MTLNNHRKLVSIIITTYNRPELLAKSLRSAINQTYDPIEIIVIDDGKSTISSQLVNRIQKLDNRVRYYSNPKPMGANYSRNKGIRLAKGEFIAGLDDDDQFLPNRIAELIKHYDDKYAFVTSLNLIVTEGKSVLSRCPSIVTLRELLKSNVLMNQGLIKKERFESVGFYDEALSACQDYDMWMKLILKFDKVKVVQTATQQIFVRNNLLRISTNSRSKFKGYFSFYKKYKYLMGSVERFIHLARIYNIRRPSRLTNALAIKIILNKLTVKDLKSISVYGHGKLLEELYPFLIGLNIRVNYIIDTYNYGGRSFGGVEVIGPHELAEKNERYVVIASVEFYSEIRAMIESHVKPSSKVTII